MPGHRPRSRCTRPRSRCHRSRSCGQRQHGCQRQHLCQRHCTKRVPRPFEGRSVAKVAARIEASCLRAAQTLDHACGAAHVKLHPPPAPSAAHDPRPASPVSPALRSAAHAPWPPPSRLRSHGEPGGGGGAAGTASRSDPNTGRAWRSVSRGVSMHGTPPSESLAWAGRQLQQSLQASAPSRLAACSL